MKKLLFLMLGIVLMAQGCQTSKVDIQAETDTIRSLENQWTSGLQTKNVDQIMDLTSNDCTIMRSNAPAIDGPQAIRDRQELMFQDTTLLYETYTAMVDTIEVAASGDLAYARGHDDISIITERGIVQEKGKWVDVWKKIDGEWKAIISISNSDEPLAEE